MGACEGEEAAITLRCIEYFILIKYLYFTIYTRIVLQTNLSIFIEAKEPTLGASSKLN